MPPARKKSTASLRLSFGKTKGDKEAFGDAKVAVPHRRSTRKSGSISPRRSGTIHHPEADDVNGEVWIESMRNSQIQPDGLQPSSANHRTPDPRLSRSRSSEYLKLSNLTKLGRKRARAEAPEPLMPTEEVLVADDEEDFNMDASNGMAGDIDHRREPQGPLLSPFEFTSDKTRTRRPPPPRLLRLSQASSLDPEHLTASPLLYMEEVENDRKDSAHHRHHHNKNNNSSNNSNALLAKRSRRPTRASYQEDSPLSTHSVEQRSGSSTSPSEGQHLRIRIGVMPLPGTPQEDQTVGELCSEQYLMPRNFFQLPQSSSRGRATNIVGWSGVFPEIPLPPLADWIGSENNQGGDFRSSNFFSVYHNVVGDRFSFFRSGSSRDERLHHIDRGGLRSHEEAVVTGSITAIVSPS